MRISPSGEIVARGIGVFTHLWLLVKITDFCGNASHFAGFKNLSTIQNVYRVLLFPHFLILLPDELGGNFDF
jgi:hypothetical protein